MGTAPRTTTVRIVDFCCHEQRLVIELDGGQHAIELEVDQKRTKFLISRGYRVCASRIMGYWTKAKRSWRRSFRHCKTLTFSSRRRGEGKG